METTRQTWIACLTPPGRAALATLALRGPNAWKAVQGLFRPASGSLPVQPEAGQFWFGTLGEDGRGERDEVVLSVRHGEPCPWLEVHCHGGPELLRMLSEVFAGRGIAMCSWQDLEARTSSDPLRQRAQAALAEAATVRTAAILLDQFHAVLSLALGEIREALGTGRVTDAESRLDALVAQIPLGRHLTQPWRLVIAGAVNVGKSSLINALAGYERSLVDAAPGTTRDVVTTVTAIDGWPVELADTAGRRRDAGTLEQQGLALAENALANADLCLWVLDGSTIPVFPPTASEKLRYLINKTDLEPAWNWADVPQALHLSAKTGAGITPLCESLSRWLVPMPPPPGAPVPFTPQLCDMIEKAKEFLAQGKINDALAAIQWTIANG